MAKISAFIIAKNEEAGIGKALKSLVSFCDEVVVIDTGSNDRTKEIALDYTEKIFDFKWVDDFSAARNFALSKCTGDWIVWLDADDEIPLQMQVKIREIIKSSPPAVAGFLVTYKYSEQKEQLLPRIFRNRMGLVFKMPVHEYLDVPGKILKNFRVCPEIRIIHHKTASENEAALKRNIGILEKSLKKALKKPPGKKTLKSEVEHIRFFLGRDYLNLGEYGAAAEIFTALAADGTIKDRSFRYSIFLHRGRALAIQQKYTEALESFKLAHQEDSRFNEPLILQADIYLYNLDDPIQAKSLYRQALEIPPPKSTFSINPAHYYAYPENQLHKIAQLDKPIMLICGYYGKLNIGDELMLAALIQKYQAKYRIIAASYAPAITQKIHRIESVPHRHAYFDRALGQSEIVLIGGGTLFHDQGMAANKNVEYYCGIIGKAHRLNKKIYLEGIGVDRIRLPKNQKLIKEKFPKCDKIEVRDRESLQNLLACGLPPDSEKSGSIKIARDLVLNMRLPATQSPASPMQHSLPSSKPLIGINLCPPPADNPQKLIQKIDRVLIPFIKKNHQKFDFIFIPGSEEDVKLTAYLKEKTNVTFPCFKPDLNNYIQSYINIIASCDRLFAARYHLIILGGLLGKQTYALSYSEKTDNLKNQA